MASSQPYQNHPTDKEEEGHHNPPPPAAQAQQYPAPVTEYGTTMGYPAPMGYPMGYPPPPPFSPEEQQEQEQIRKLSSIFRGIIAGLIFFFLLACVISIITWLVLHPAIPIFHVNTMQVSNFTISPPPIFLTANWVANITASNPNEKLEIEFDDIDIYMLYNDEYVAGSSSAEPFRLNAKENVTLEVKVSASNNITDDSYEHTEKVMGKIATERNSSGKVTFGLRMIFWGTFKSGRWWGRNVSIKISCGDLEIGFLNNNSTSGSLANANSLGDCMVD